jgi:uncharacterized membrane protein SirB2
MCPECGVNVDAARRWRQARGGQAAKHAATALAFVGGIWALLGAGVVVVGNKSTFLTFVPLLIGLLLALIACASAARQSVGSRRAAARWCVWVLAIIALMIPLLCFYSSL